MDIAAYVADKRTANTKKGELRPTSDALERWTTRIYARKLHLMGEDGAMQYLSDYGRGIAAPKCVALAVVCEVNGFLAIAEGFWKKAFELETGTAAPITAEFSTPKTTPAKEGYFRVPGSVMIPSFEKPAPVASPFPSHLQPGRIVTMQPVDAKYPRQHYIDDDNYLGQAKIDGRRMVVIADGNEVYYQSRSTKKCGTPDVNIHADLTALMGNVGPFILDGEVVYYSYDESEHRTGAQAAIVNVNAGHPEIQPRCEYAIFEALYAHGQDLTDTAKMDRIEQAESIEAILHECGLDENMRISVLRTFCSRLEKTFLAEQMQTHQREGEVWTHKYAKYIGGKDEKNENSVRTKYLPEFVAVILGLTQTSAEGRPFGAIEIGIRDIAGHIKPVGSVGTGYTVAQMLDIYHRFMSSTPGTVRIMVKSQGFTENGQVWQGRYLGFAEEEE